MSIAAHAHADALAIEVRHEGVEILVDPGTYCYGSEPFWRSYFRSTIGHNTLELAGQDQSASGGPTLWMRSAQTRLIGVEAADDGRITCWSAEHNGYTVLDPPAWHRRTVRLSSAPRCIEIADQIRTAGRHTFRLAYHLGPAVPAELTGSSVALSWDDGGDARTTARLLLPADLEWSLVRASSHPILGWYSERFGEKEPSTTVVGEGVCQGEDDLISVLQFCSD